MIVRQFITWVRTAPAGERAEATRCLARAWLQSDLSEDDRAAAEGALLMLLDDASPLVRQAMAEVFSRSTDAPAAIVQEKGLAQVSDTAAIEKFCDEAIATNPNPVADYKAGKVAALNSLKGQVMKLSKGKANPAQVNELLKKQLGG